MEEKPVAEEIRELREKIDFLEQAMITLTRHMTTLTALVGKVQERVK